MRIATRADLVTDTVALWIPPGEDEMSEAAVEGLTALVDRELPPEAQTQPHADLTLLATRPDHRGGGGYERRGFAKAGAFEDAVPGSVVSTMWRSANG